MGGESQENPVLCLFGSSRCPYLAPIENRRGAGYEKRKPREEGGLEFVIKTSQLTFTFDLEKRSSALEPEIDAEDG